MENDNAAPESQDTAPPIEAPPRPEPVPPGVEPFRWSELLAMLAMVVLCDLTIYRGNGFSGYALLFVVAPLLLVVGAVRRSCGAALGCVGILLALLAGRMAWQGSGLMIGVGFALLVAFAAALAGQRPYVLAVAIFASQTLWAGVEALRQYGRRWERDRSSVRPARWLNFALPAAALLVFGMIFVLANPAVLEVFSERAKVLIIELREWLLRFSLTEVLFWFFVLWVTIGLLRPLAGRMQADEVESMPPVDAIVVGGPTPAPLYAAFRNTLLTVIVLFAGYLVFEFSTLWFRDFPAGFYYAGYAHEGAAWLTLALGLATAMLSLVFRGRMLQDARLPWLRRLAWIWCLENFLLALAVYNRLLIYIGFNGLTRMRIVGLFGISVVVIGFVLVVCKIAQQRRFSWLMRNQLLALAMTVYVFSIVPVDSITVTYNVRRVLAGDPAPSVQLVAHPISAEGILFITPLLDGENETIREGVRAMLAQRLEQAEAAALRRQRLGWTALQLAEDRELELLRSLRAKFAEYQGPAARERTYRRFVDYAYQWY